MLLALCCVLIYDTNFIILDYDMNEYQHLHVLHGAKVYVMNIELLCFQQRLRYQIAFLGGLALLTTIFEFVFKCNSYNY